jgi:preprotein translocase subunit YajC
MTVWTALAWAQAEAPAVGSSSFFVSMLPFLLIFVVFYFLLILPQQRRQKKHRSLLETLKKGDKVYTTGGVVGTVVAVAKDTVTLQVSDNVRVKFLREYVADRFEEEEPGKG